MAENSKTTQVQADAAFRKAQKATREQDKSEAMLEYEAGVVATREKSERLKALRLAKEEADRKAETMAKIAKTAKAKAAKDAKAAKATKATKASKAAKAAGAAKKPRAAKPRQAAGG